MSLGGSMHLAPLCSKQSNWLGRFLKGECLSFLPSQVWPKYPSVGLPPLLFFFLINASPGIKRFLWYFMLGMLINTVLMVWMSINFCHLRAATSIGGKSVWVMKFYRCHTPKLMVICTFLYTIRQERVKEVKFCRSGN